MLRPTLSIVAIAIAAATTAASPASAGSPCCCFAPCVPPVVIYEPFEMPRIYVIDQGPVYSGPGIYTNPAVVLPWRTPRYPYVGRDYPEDLPPYVEPLRSRAQYRISK